jgi:hypothetical protein
VAEKELNLLQLASVDVTRLCACPPQIVLREMIKLHSVAQFRTTYQTTFSEMPLPHAVPCRLMALKTRPSGQPRCHPSIYSALLGMRAEWTGAKDMRGISPFGTANGIVILNKVPVLHLSSR